MIKKHNGFIMIEILLTICIMTFVLSGIFTFLGSLIKSTEQMMTMVRYIEQNPVVFNCYSPLISSSVVENVTEEDELLLKSFDIQHGNTGELKDSNNLCTLVNKASQEKGSLLYCFGNKDKKKEQ